MGRRKLRQRQAEEIVKKRKKDHFSIKTLRGMRDIIGEEANEFLRVNKIVHEVGRMFDFGYIETPLLENTSLYLRNPGEAASVTKEMYNFETKGGDKVSLRPDITPGFIRAYLENGMQGWKHPVKLYTTGYAFRYEKPQEGRYRQFQQINFDMIGVEESIAEAQLIQIAFYIFKKIGFKDIVLDINSLGCRDCQREFQKQLKRFFSKSRPKLCLDCQKRKKKNSLRIFDCKETRCQKELKDAPLIVDNLCKACTKHFKEVIEYLDTLKIPYNLNMRLVRGLDYYTHTVFEFVQKDGKEGRQNSLGGGGRYDHLVEEFGGRFTPAVGFGLGTDRIVQESFKKRKKRKDKPFIYLAQVGDKARRKSLKLFEKLWENGFEVKESFTKTSLKAQLRSAKQEKVRWALIVGYKESIEGNVIIRDQVTGVQTILPQSKVIEFLKDKQKEEK